MSVKSVKLDNTTKSVGRRNTIEIGRGVGKVELMPEVINYTIQDPYVGYWLEGFDADWTIMPQSSLGAITYTNLPTGTYTFHLAVFDNNKGNILGERDYTLVKAREIYDYPWFVGYIVFVPMVAVIWATWYSMRRRMQRLLERQEREMALMKQQLQMGNETIMAIAKTVDAKDGRTSRHSQRVSQYSMMIGKELGFDEKECENLRRAALMHDIGKIGIPDKILNKPDRLTDEEYAVMKTHVTHGAEILKDFTLIEHVVEGARYHHERYGGKGYPEGLKGEEIPEIARIIAVADAYDAMTSNRSYRNAIPQHIVREEIVKGMGTQFDPEFGKAMIHMIDVDTEYRMQEIISGASPTATTSLRCDSIYHDCAEGILITKKPTRIRLCSQPDDGFPSEECLPSLILFDALDGQVHPGEEDNRNLLYFEYAQIRLDGHVTARNTRNTEVRVLDQESDLERAGFGEPERGQRYKVEAARYKDHAVVRISDEDRTLQVILALPDSSRFVYIALSGEHCDLHNIRIENDAIEIGPDDIPRIAEEISYIKDCPEGDVPNVQVDGWRTDASEGILIGDGMTISFHTMSLPTARLVWHCAFISVFSSDDGRINGADFREYILLRLDGENWESDAHVKNKVQVRQQASFEGWNVWKDENEKGLDCVVTIKRNQNVITMETENLGVAVHSVTTIFDEVKDVSVALTGDQCAITDIRISHGA
jgi:putative nucleotidyltransferase with HDIG domain